MDDTISVYDPHTVATRYWHLLEGGRLRRESGCSQPEIAGSHPAPPLTCQLYRFRTDAHCGHGGVSA